MANRRAPLLTVSVAAELAGMHAQTLRQYDRLGLVSARRTRGGGRRYSLEDVERLQEIQRMSQEDGINLAGIARILQMQERIDQLTRSLQHAEQELAAERERANERRAHARRIFAAGADGDVVLTRGHKDLREYLRHQAAQRLAQLRAQEGAGPSRAGAAGSSAASSAAGAARHPGSELTRYQPHTLDLLLSALAVQMDWDRNRERDREHGRVPSRDHSHERSRDRSHARDRA
ncbi:MULTISPECIES: heat shock protein transcriptional repressor HspR [Actinotignum]|uniref:MerR family transcriptional regulator n=1 Tax=Actinotignum timonense TaxID=1870995 RepID=A0AAW9HJF0_9ACTO|nr:MerR family transcriptional regulator [Actinotignum timonense]MDY5134433.1 MerR family transcriptional regulator [Actinotignum timonense]MDY5140920.1 MerR family transcriptional regulator [Actinotignum timonense]MDY5145810.1 MerR family transcriptional regulator [Actinotignum timonense]MDY5149006.1 MerR family transcriptional regulator [Actinotignum timonense]MDY5156492.1 MerR family transcriptional regulator [Actinotignum timonense]